jgi:hypothetical protein
MNAGVKYAAFLLMTLTVTLAFAQQGEPPGPRAVHNINAMSRFAAACRRRVDSTPGVFSRPPAGTDCPTIDASAECRKQCGFPWRQCRLSDLSEIGCRVRGTGLLMDVFVIAFPPGKGARLS